MKVLCPVVSVYFFHGFCGCDFLSVLVVNVCAVWLFGGPHQFVVAVPKCFCVVVVLAELADKLLPLLCGMLFRGVV